MYTRIGEIIESSTLQYTAGSYELLAAPPFGSLVLAHTQEPALQIYGVVTDVRTVSREPGGRAVVRGLSYGGRELHNEQIYAAHPDLREVLQTEFAVWVLGYREGARVLHRVPRLTAPIHYDVEAADREALQAFGADFGFLRMLLGAAHLPVDDLIAAVVATLMLDAPIGPHAYALRACQAVAELLRDDIPRVRQIISRIRSSAAL